MSPNDNQDVLLQSAKERDSFHATEQAYGGREAYARAKEAGQTELTYRQWVQVRTPEFKAWFGDWEGLRAQQRLDEMTPLELALPENLRDVPIEELRAEVEKRLNALVENGKASHPEIGEVRFSKGNNKKAIHTSSVPEKLHAAHEIVQVIESSLRVNSVQSTKPDEAGRGVHYHTLAIKVQAFGREFVTIITIKETGDGKRFYNNIAVTGGQKDAPAAYPRSLASKDVGVTSAFTGAGQSVLPAMRRVNPDTVSKVTNPRTGEPLVVYHYTDEQFTQFELSKARQSSDVPAFFFTTDPDMGMEYGENEMQVFLNIRNPTEKPSITPEKDGRALRAELEAQGHDGTLVDDSYDDVLSIEYAALNPNQIKSATTNDGAFSADNNSILHQADTLPRGMFDRNSNTIAVLRNADASTFAHELGHFFLEMHTELALELQGRADLTAAQQQLVQDMQTVMDWFGVQDVAAWKALTLEEQWENHERFARGFEAYMYEGKAPSNALRDVFRRFAAEQQNKRIFLPKIGWVRYRNSRQVSGSLKNVTISMKCGKLFVSIQTEFEQEAPAPKGGEVGIDMGVVRFATLSNGQYFEPINALKICRWAICPNLPKVGQNNMAKM